jgi:hypothetical protein
VMVNVNVSLSAYMGMPGHLQGSTVAEGLRRHDDVAGIREAISSCVPWGRHWCHHVVRSGTGGDGYRSPPRLAYPS